jgi:hypothetical protein
VHYIFFVLFFSLTSILHAQFSWGNKPLVVQTSLKQTIAYHIPYQETLMQLTQDRLVEYQLMNDKPDELHIRSQVKNLKGKVIAFGQEQLFDSNKRDSLSDGEKTLIDSMLQPSIQIVSATGNSKTNQIASLSFEPEDIRKFFLANQYRNVNTAFSWKDSTTMDSSKSVYECTFLRKQIDTIQVHVFATHQIKNTIKQGDQVISQVLKGVEQSMRYYNSKTGILMKEQRLIQFEGIAESQNTRFPVSVKLESIVIGQWKTID